MANQETNPNAPFTSIPRSDIFSLLTSNEREAYFTELISTPDPRRQIQSIASTMVSNPDNFSWIIKNKNGTKRVQKLLGISPEADLLFYHAILSRFFNIMTERNSYDTVAQAMKVFDQEKKRTLEGLIYWHSLKIACTRYGQLVLGEIIANEEDHQFKNRLFDVVAYNALFLSNDVYGNFVVQRVLELNDVRATHNVSVMLRGHCINLSFNKQGSFIVEKILDATVQTMARVVEEFLMCDEDTLVKVASDRFGNFVVAKALTVTHEKMHPAYLFSSLVRRLMPLRHLFGRSKAISDILDSTVQYNY